MKHFFLLLLLQSSFFGTLTVVALQEEEQDWWPTIELEFGGLDNQDHPPLKKCRKRKNIAPSNSTQCDKTPKMCFFGNQDCGDSTSSYPSTRCVCQVPVGTRNGMWSCVPEPCPTPKMDDGAITMEEIISLPTSSTLSTVVPQSSVQPNTNTIAPALPSQPPSTSAPVASTPPVDLPSAFPNYSSKAQYSLRPTGPTRPPTPPPTPPPQWWQRTLPPTPPPSAPPTPFPTTPTVPTSSPAPTTSSSPSFSPSGSAAPSFSPSGVPSKEGPCYLCGDANGWVSYKSLSSYQCENLQYYAIQSLGETIRFRFPDLVGPGVTHLQTCEEVQFYAAECGCPSREPTSSPAPTTSALPSLSPTNSAAPSEDLCYLCGAAIGWVSDESFTSYECYVLQYYAYFNELGRLVQFEVSDLVGPGVVLPQTCDEVQAYEKQCGCPPTEPTSSPAPTISPPPSLSPTGSAAPSEEDFCYLCGDTTGWVMCEILVSYTFYTHGPLSLFPGGRSQACAEVRASGKECGCQTQPTASPAPTNTAPPSLSATPPPTRPPTRPPTPPPTIRPTAQPSPAPPPLRVPTSSPAPTTSAVPSPSPTGSAAPSEGPCYLCGDATGWVSWWYLSSYQCGRLQDYADANRLESLTHFDVSDLVGKGVALPQTCDEVQAYGRECGCPQTEPTLSPAPTTSAPPSLSPTGSAAPSDSRCYLCGAYGWVSDSWWKCRIFQYRAFYDIGLLSHDDMSDLIGSGVALPQTCDEVQAYAKECGCPRDPSTLPNRSPSIPLPTPRPVTQPSPPPPPTLPPTPPPTLPPTPPPTPPPTRRRRGS